MQRQSGYSSQWMTDPISPNKAKLPGPRRGLLEKGEVRIVTHAETE